MGEFAEATKPEQGQLWRWEGTAYFPCLAGWFQTGEREVQSSGWKIAKCAEGDRCDKKHSFFGDESFQNGTLKFIGWAPGYGPQPPDEKCGATSETHPTLACHLTSVGFRWQTDARKSAEKPARFDPNKVCGAHGQPQFILGCVLPCANPGCGCGTKGESYDFPMAGRDGYYRVRFERTYQHLTEDTGLWRWKVCPSVPADDQSLAAKLRVDGWEDAIIKQAAKTVSKPVKRGSMPIPAELSGSIMSARQAGKSITAAAMQQAYDAQRQALNYGLIRGATLQSIQYDELSKLNEETLMKACEDIERAIAKEKERQAQSFFGIDRDLGQPRFAEQWALTGHTIPDLTNAVMAKIKANPQKREVSVDGRNWIDYERLADADSFDVYRHRRVDGVPVPMMATPMSYKIVGEYVDNEGTASRPVGAQLGGFIRAKKPAPWKGSVDDLDLLPDVSP